MGGIVVKSLARILHGHDWVFSSEVLKVFGKPADGDVISLKDGRDHLIGSAIYNSKSQIVARRFSRRKQDLDLDFFKRRIGQAAEYRALRRVDPKLCRVVWSESDGLPGVIIDRYGEHFSLQTLTLAMDMRKEIIANAVVDWFESRASFQLAIRQQASNRRVLDCFANQGAFALVCASAGASEVTAVEAGAENISAARGNAERNELSVNWIKQDVFQFLRAAERAQAQYDLIILDPPSFTKTKSGIGDAMRGYRELHMRAFKLFSNHGF